MKKLFVPYKLALLAKEKGFDEKCLCIYMENENNRLQNLGGTYQNSLAYKDNLAAPLYQQLVDWFREKYLLSIEVSEWSKHFSGKIKPIGKSLKFQSADKSYYEALEAALTEAFKLI